MTYLSLWLLNATNSLLPAAAALARPTTLAAMSGTNVARISSASSLLLSFSLVVRGDLGGAGVGVGVGGGERIPLRRLMYFKIDSSWVSDLSWSLTFLKLGCIG